jgi:hypothetical protein
VPLLDEGQRRHMGCIQPRRARAGSVSLVGSVIADQQHHHRPRRLIMVIVVAADDDRWPGRRRW